MPNPFDTDPRSPSIGRLAVLGACLIIAAVAVATLLVAKSEGEFAGFMRVNAQLVNVGDGLPAKSDVKFRGVMVGFVDDVIPAQIGLPNVVRINLKPEFANAIPNTVTARVVPSNAFAVSSVQLVDMGPGPALRPGAVIREDTTLPTLLFQTTLDKIRRLLAAVGREPNPDSVGALTALGEAAQGRGGKLLEAGGDLSAIVRQLNDLVVPDTGPSTIAALADAATALKSAAPSLYDALDHAITPARTLAEKRVALTNLISAGLTTTGAVRDALDHQTDRLINITTQLSPVLGVFADNANQFPVIATRLNRLSAKIYSVWDPRLNNIPQFTILSLSPFRPYVRADCPRYGDLLGPSCATAPDVPTAPNLLPALGSMGFPPKPGLSENRPNLTPPRGAGDSYGRFGDPPPPPDAAPPPGGPPATPNTPSPDAPLLPAEAPPSTPASPGAPAEPQSADLGAIGTVGSAEEKDQLSRIVGGPANAATVLLLGPQVRGTTVSMEPDTGGNQ